MPFLIRVETGLPLSSVMYWVIASRRPSGRQPNTLYNELRSLMYLFLWADARGIDVDERLSEGHFFTLSEMVDLADVCGRFIDDILSEVAAADKVTLGLNSRRNGRGRAVKSGEKRNRLASIYSLIEFTSADFLSQLSRWPPRWNFYSNVRNECLASLKAQTDGLVRRNVNDLGGPEGLHPDDLARLRSVIEPDHPENPFSFGVRFRNYLLIRLLIELGIRRGELLGIRVSDCSLGRSGTITIHRRPDDPDDPRLHKPATKTAARLLALSARMTELIHEYVLHYRSKIPGARNHPFLLVDARTGNPLSLSSVNKILTAVRKRVPDMPAELAPHVLRHSWNDTFSDLMDKKGVPADQEAKWRMRLMGWRNENTAIAYQRRTVRRRSNEALQEMQNKLDVQVPGISR